MSGFHRVRQDIILTPEIPKIVVLCGSTRFHDVFVQANFAETMKGNIVLSVGFFGHSAVHGEGVECSKEQKKFLDELHKRKIDLADEVLVMNVDGYIGSSTRSEIEYAQRTGKPIRYWESVVTSSTIGPLGNLL